MPTAENDYHKESTLAEEDAIRKVQAADDKRKKQIMDEEKQGAKLFDRLIEMDERKKKGNVVEYHTDRVAVHLLSLYEDSKRARKLTEDRWMKDFRQYKGEYEPEVIARMHPLRSKAFIRLTSAKVKQSISRLSDFLFPANGDKNWSVSPSPIPELDEGQMRMLVDQYAEQTGQELSPAALRELIYDTADKAARQMSKTIEDQLSDLHYREIMREVLRNGAIYGTGILKGPLLKIKRTNRYVQDGEGNWIPLVVENIMPFCESVSIWDFYPDMTARTIDNARYVFQRHVMDKSKVLALAKRGDFRGDAIRDYLSYENFGDHENTDVETELDEIGDNNATRSSIMKDNKYEVLEYWGYIDSHDMEMLGIDIPDKYKGSLEVKANIWVLGEKVIKAALNPLDGSDWPYYLYYFDKDESSVFGEGLSSILRDTQELMNASFRAMLDNAAISAGPQIEANVDLLGPDEDPTQTFPFKVWLRTGTGMEAQQQAIRVHTLPSYTNEFIQMIGLTDKLADDVSTIPKMLGQQGGAANLGGSQRTMGGLSMLMGTANLTMKDQVKNFDDGITKPFIAAMYAWNMQFNDNPEIKGDYEVVARGTSSLIAKEVYLDSLIKFLEITNNPVDGQYLNRVKLIRDIADVLDLTDKQHIKSDEQIQAEQERQAQSQKEEQQFATMIVERAREGGVSPEDLLNTIAQLRDEMMEANQMAQQGMMPQGAM